MKRFSFGNNGQHVLSQTYTNRKQINHYEINYTVVGTTTHGANYQYFADGRLSYSSELNNPDQDRAYTYDHTGRLAQVLTGAEARNEATPNPDYVPFRQNYGFDAWNNMSSRTGQHWGHNTTAHSATYVNNRNTSPQWTHDAAGQILQQTAAQITRQYSFDAAAREVTVTETPRRSGRPALTLSQAYDGDGQRIKRTENSMVMYELRSSVLGGLVLADLNAQGSKAKGYVYADGKLLAKQPASDTVLWVHRAPDGTGDWVSYGGGDFVGSGRQSELDPMGNDVGMESPYLAGGDGLGNYPHYGDPADMTMGCTLDGSAISCEVMGKVIIRNQHAALSHIITGRIGMRVEQNTTETVYDGKSILIDSGSEQLPNGDYKAFVTVKGTPAFLKSVSLGSSMVWLEFRPIQQLTPQDTRRRGDQRRQPVQKPPSACAKFAEELANRLFNTVSDGGYHPDTRKDLAHQMVRHGVNNVDFYGVKYDKVSYPISGFKNELIRYRQYADVYRHVLYAGGNALLGTPGGVVGGLVLEGSDRIGRDIQGRKESETELKDDAAGEAVGNAMLETALAGKRGDYAGLKAKIKGILCDY